MNEPILIWGASGHARVVADIFRLNGCAVAGFLDDINPQKHGTAFCGSPVLGGREKLKEIRRSGVERICIGIGCGRTRLELAELAEGSGFTLTSAFHPSAVIAADAIVGAGTVVAAGAILNPTVTLGRNVIVNTGATIDHDCHVEDGAHVCPGVHLAGEVTVGKLSWIGIGSVVIDRMRIGSNVLLGAGAVVVQDIPDNVVAYGNPARVVRRRNTSNGSSILA